jgi:zinc and cadmium transporter
MITEWLYALGSVLFVSLLSLIGVFTLSIKDQHLNKVLIYLVSFSAGALFGDAFFHLLPEIVNEVGFTFEISIYVLLGIIASFIVEGLIHWHHCHSGHERDHPHRFAKMNLVGDAMHNFIDGIIIGASYLISIPVGIATTIAVILHEIPQEIGDFGVLLHGGYSKGKALFLNFLVAIVSVFGVLISLLLSSAFDKITIFLIPFAAGNFIYVAGADLIPEIHKDHPVFWKVISKLFVFILGIAFMALLLLIE